MLTIYGIEDSVVQEYANRYLIPFKTVDLASSSTERHLTVSKEMTDSQIVLMLDTDISILSKFLPIAFYDSNGKMLHIFTIPTIKDRNSLMIVLDKVPNAKYAKVFLWDSGDNLSPVSKSEKVYLENN